MKRVYSVSQMNGYIGRMFRSDYLLNHLYIKGEVSNCKYHSSGHIYFSLKDEKSSLSCIMFASARKDGLKFTMEDGQTVIVEGNIGTYERDGVYQLYASEITLDGIGALYEEYERLKMKLYEEGLFDHEIKKPIPKHPTKVGIVTAKTGAAIQDIVSIAKRRNPYVQLILYPAKVQGTGAGASIAMGIKKLDSMNLDTIIIGRGGGSIEDLWGFNEEIVARAIYDAKTPIISGTGHETDTTIADYAADLRAATPSAACELAIPNVMEQIQQIEEYGYSLKKYMNQKIVEYQFRMKQYEMHLEMLSPKEQLKQKKMRLLQIQSGLEQNMSKKKTAYDHRLQIYIERLHGLSPLQKLTGGYGFLSDEKGNAIRSYDQVERGDLIHVTMKDGVIDASVIDAHEVEAERNLDA